MPPETMSPDPVPVASRAPLVLPVAPDLRLGAALRGARTEFVVILAAVLVFVLALDGRTDTLHQEQLVGLALSAFALAIVGVVDAVLLARSRRNLEATHDDLRATTIDLASAYDAALLANGVLHRTAAARDRALGDLARAATEREAFLAALAHDLKTPLTLIRGHAQLLAGTAHRPGVGSPAHGPVDPKRLVAGLGSIEAAVVQMTDLIDELLDLAQIDAGQLPVSPGGVPSAAVSPAPPTDLVALARRVVEAHDGATARHRITFRTGTEALVGRWDGPRLERGLGHVVANAVKYCPSGGDIRVTLDRVEATAPSDPAGGWAILTVADEGLGIPAADLPRVFDRFHRAANVVGRLDLPGTGLGLAALRHTLATHGGDVSVASTEGAGTTVMIRLPVTG